MNTILITGGLGFIGSHAAISFAQRGYHVVVIDNLSRPTPNLHNKEEVAFNLQYFRTNFPQIEIHIEDIREKEKIAAIFQKHPPTIILHAAGQTSAVGSVQDPADDFENNVVGLFTILEAARLFCKCPIFLYLSSNKVYGSGANSLPLKEENTRYSPTDTTNLGLNEDFTIDQSTHTPYGVSKLCGDLYVQEYGHLYNMHTVVFRMSCIYGPRQFGFIEQGWVSHLIIDAIHGKTIEIFGNGKQVRDILYIDDLVDLMAAVISQKETDQENGLLKGSEVFNVGGSLKHAVSLLEMIDFIEQAVDETINVKKKDWRPADQKYFVCDISKVSHKYNWSPKIPPKVGIERTAQWLIENKNLFY